MKEIMLLRHGQASSDNSYTDYQRPLTALGMGQSQKLGQTLHRERLFPQSILSSPATRAQQTSQLVAEQLMIPASGIRYDDVLYLASADIYLDSLRRFSSRYKRIMLVAHNPGLEDVIALLTNEHHTVTPASLFILAIEDDWNTISQGNCQVVKHFSATDH